MKRFTLLFVAIVALGLLAVSPAAAQFTAWSEVPADFVPTVGPTPPGLPAAPVAGLTFYTDRPSFQAVAPGLPLEDFSGTLVPPNGVLACPSPLNSATNDGCFPTGGVIDGFELNAIPGPDYVVVTTGFLGVLFNVVGPNVFLDDTNLLFDPPVNAVGFDVVAPLGAITVNIDIYDAGGVLLGSTTSPGSLAGDFWGVTSATAIGRIDMVEPAGGAELFGNLEFGAFSSVLEVPTLSTLGAALLVVLLVVIGLVAIIRRR